MAVPVPPVLEVENLSVWFERRSGPTIHAVRGVSLAIRPGETLCIVGESGSGKTMTASALMRLLPPQARMRVEALRLGGRDLTGLSERQLADIRGAEIGMVFQNPSAALNPAHTIGRQLAETYRRHRGGTAAAARERAVAMLERVEIPDGAERLGQYPHQLSGGLAQRVMIALALLCEPKVLIADEPTTALDVTTQAGILRLLARLQRELGMALVMVTHDLRIVSRIADRVAVMYGGQIVETGSRRDIFLHGAHPYTRALLESIPGAGRDRLAIIGGTPPTITRDDALCAFRDRCRRAAPRCASEGVSLEPFGPGRQVRCLFPVAAIAPARATA